MTVSASSSGETSQTHDARARTKTYSIHYSDNTPPAFVSGRCDQIIHCRDESDEAECRGGVLKEGYNKNIPPATQERTNMIIQILLFLEADSNYSKSIANLSIHYISYSIIHLYSFSWLQRFTKLRLKHICNQSFSKLVYNINCNWINMSVISLTGGVQ